MVAPAPTNEVNTPKDTPATQSGLVETENGTAAMASSNPSQVSESDLALLGIKHDGNLELGNMLSDIDRADSLLDYIDNRVDTLLASLDGILDTPVDNK
ncbi:hypothetical protein IWQ62_002418 [Dispira parvispora]|uniref:Uncharacterized protein n=1 Tax=Dispira parvispora TaxID=1520584 RepID=A0A9W8ARD3_9FUNG|nr:hypothetical protein IWQ62_002418 [Dispira parvispora]